MAAVGAWNVPAGTEKEIKVHRRDVKVMAGAVEHKNRPESIFITISSWVKPKLAITKARASSTSEPEELVIKTALDFEQEVRRAAKRFGHCFDSKYFDPQSIIFTMDYAPNQATVAKRQYMEIEINIDTANTIGHDDQPAPNPLTGRVEMYSFSDLEHHIAQAVDKILNIDAFESNRSVVSFDVKKGAA